MPISISLIRHSPSLIAPGAPKFSLKNLISISSYSSIAAQDFLTHLQKNQSHIEKTLNKVKSKLDSGCIVQVLEKCAAEKPKLGVRFFVWAALHPTHRHSWYTYSKACKLLNLEKNPRIISDVVDEYKAEGLVVSIKMFKVLLNLCGAADDAEMGLWVLRKMKEFGCMPDTVSYNVVIRLLVAKCRLDEAMGLLKEMSLFDLHPDMISYVCIIKSLCDAGELTSALALINDMKEHGCVPNTVVYSTILDGICMHGSLEIALKFLEGMEKGNEEYKPNVVTYTIMIKGFVEKGKNDEALGILDRMEDSGLKPGKVTFATLFDGLSKEGRVEEACKVIERYRGMGVGVGYDVLYDMLVMSLFRAGKVKESEEMFRTSLASGLRPGGLTSSSIIRKVVSEGRVLDGYFLFQEVAKFRDLVSVVGPEVYSVLLAGLCKGNHLKEAEGLANVVMESGVNL